MPDAATAGRRSWTIPRPSRSRRSTSSDQDGRLVPVEVSAVGMVDDDGTFAGIHGVDPRHQRAGAPRARAARVRGALPVPRRVLAGPRLADRRRGTLRPSSATRRETMLGSDRDRADRAGRTGECLRARRRAARSTVRFQLAGAASERRSSGSRLPFLPCRRPRRARSRSTAIGMIDGRPRSSGPTARRATSATATGSSATCAARPASSPPARSGPTSPASSTTR